MPIIKVEPGQKINLAEIEANDAGSFNSKKKAGKQGQAAYASGYKGK